MQEKMKDMNENEPEDHQMIFRIGINIGDVMVSKGESLWDAVNVAARLESAAQPQVFVSQNRFLI
ncbi:MAG: hypothetical protein CM1200mP30_19080 [Pseudomonadota bacterium]|nr:MAG: hypothetical protein CM1200mP30_19080 [Pseudomonadota bacterium]